MYIAHFVYLTIHRWLGCFHLLALMNNVSMNRCVQMSVRYYIRTCFTSFGFILRSGTDGPYGKSMLNFLRNTLFSIAATTLHIPTSSAQCFYNVSPHPHQHSLFSGFCLFVFIVAINNGCEVVQ